MILVPITPPTPYPTAGSLRVAHVMPKIGASTNCCSCQLCVCDNAGVELSPAVNFEIPDNVYQSSWGDGPDGDMTFAQAVATSAGYSPITP